MTYNATLILNFKQNMNLKKILAWEQAFKRQLFIPSASNYTFVTKFSGSDLDDYLGLADVDDGHTHCECASYH
jgi:hypothetical protein